MKVEIDVEQLKLALIHYENAEKMLKAFPFSIKQYYKLGKLFREEEAKYVCWQTLNFFQRVIGDTKQQIDLIIGGKDAKEVTPIAPIIEPAKTRRKRSANSASIEAV